ncbi:MAG: 30S ribosome-binding factor RbfA [Peptococcaceae bacterium]|nr:30S ribosome-binding factor RbfA [Peptococcaceae bacterium]
MHNDRGHRRGHRLAGLLKEEISRILREDLKDPRLGFVTVTDVEVSDDLKSTKVFVSVMGNEEAIQENMELLESAAPFIRSQVAHIIQLRHVPDIVFKYDPSIQHGARISKLLTDMGKGEG